MRAIAVVIRTLHLEGDSEQQWAGERHRGERQLPAAGAAASHSSAAMLGTSPATPELVVSSIPLTESRGNLRKHVSN